MSKIGAGRIVQCKDGKIGRTYNNEPAINGKIPVYIIAESKEDMQMRRFLETKPKRLCNPEDLKVIGYAD